MKRDRAASGPALVLVRQAEPKPSQRAQLVWSHALEATHPVNRHDASAVVLELLRTAHHDVATMSHALSLGRDQRRDHPTDLAARRGIDYLEQALAFMGVEPRVGTR